MGGDCRALYKKRSPNRLFQESRMSPALITALYGVFLAGSGIYRHISNAGGNAKALGFGLFVGVVALIGAALLAKNKLLAGKILAFVSVLFVVGFFGTMTIKGSYALDARIGASLLFSVIEAVVLLTAKPKSE